MWGKPQTPTSPLLLLTAYALCIAVEQHAAARQGGASEGGAVERARGGVRVPLEVEATRHEMYADNVIEKLNSQMNGVSEDEIT